MKPPENTLFYPFGKSPLSLPNLYLEGKADFVGTFLDVMRIGPTIPIESKWNSEPLRAWGLVEHFSYPTHRVICPPSHVKG